MKTISILTLLFSTVTSIAATNSYQIIGKCAEVPLDDENSAIVLAGSAFTYVLAPHGFAGNWEKDKEKIKIVTGIASLNDNLQDLSLTHLVAELPQFHLTEVRRRGSGVDLKWTFDRPNHVIKHDERFMQLGFFEFNKVFIYSGRFSPYTDNVYPVCFFAYKNKVLP